MIKEGDGSNADEGSGWARGKMCLQGRRDVSIETKSKNPKPKTKNPKTQKS